MRDKERESFVLYVNKTNPKDKQLVPLRAVKPDTKNNPIFNEIPKIDASSRLTLQQIDPDRKLISFAPPHDTPTRARLANMYESDPSVKRIIKFFTSYVYGTKPKQRIVPLQTETPPKKSDLDKAVDKILGTKGHRKFKEFIAKVDELSDIHIHARRLYQQSFVYGTAVGWKSFSTKTIVTPETDIEIPIKTPIRIKPINGFQLGDIYQDVETFQPRYYGYNNQHQILAPVVAEDKKTVFEELVYNKDVKPSTSIKEKKSLRLPFERLIVFDRENAGVTPDTYYYGMSPLLPLIYHSENIRRIDQKILPELNETSYAPVGIFKVGKESPWNLEQLAAELSVAGNKIVINDDVEYQEVKIDNKLEQILHEKDVLKKDLLMGTGMPSSIFNSEEMTNRACYSEDTETLTENGWKFYWEIDEENEKIATFNPENESIEYHKPIGKYVYDYEGDMINFHSQMQDILVTPEHKMWCRSGPHRNTWSKKEAKELYDTKIAYFRSHINPIQNQKMESMMIPSIKQGLYNRVGLVELMKMDVYLELLGYYLSEGTRSYSDCKWSSKYHVALSQSLNCNVEKADKIEKCLTNSGFKFGSYIDKKDNVKRWQIDNKQLHNLMSLETGENHLTKRIPRWILQTLGEKQLRILFDALILGDGTIDKRENRTNKTYYTTSKQLANDVQELALKLGYYARIRTYDDKRQDNIRNRIYRVQISKSNGNTVHDIKKTPYNGVVYCFEVPNHLFITRRNGKIAIQGNTAEITVNIFKSVTLDDEREFINEIMWKQWYRDLLAIFFKGKDYLDLDIKVELEFPARTFTPFIDKADALRETYLNGGISLPEWRTGIDYPANAEEELKIPESADQKSNFGNQMGGNPNPDGSGTPTASPTTKNNTKQGSPKPASGNQNLQGNQNTVKQTKQVITTKEETKPARSPPAAKKKK